MKACIIITITENDTGPQLANLVGIGNTGLKDYMVGRNQDPDSGEFEYWVVAYNGNAVTFTNGKGNQEEIPLVVLLAYNDPPQAVVDKMGQLASLRPTLCRSIGPFNPPLTRAEMIARLKVEVGQEIAADKFWLTQPGDDVTTGVTSKATLAGKFKDVATALAKG